MIASRNDKRARRRTSRRGPDDGGKSRAEEEEPRLCPALCDRLRFKSS